jgi:hypothetical protein
MTTWLASFGGVAFLGAIIAVHWAYFESNFSVDGRLAIRLPLTLDPGVKHLLLRPAAQGGFHPGANVRPLAAVAGGMAPEITGADLPFSTRLQPKNVLIAPAQLLAEPVSSLAFSSWASMASVNPPGSDKTPDRVVINDSHVLLEGIVTETELVCWGDVEIATGAVIGACMKVRGNMYVGANVTFLGSVVVNGNIRTGEKCVFLFDVVSKGEISFGKGTRLGSSTDELVIPAARKRLTDQQDLAATTLSGLQYEMRYG